jgi:hypothetical protein
MMDKPKHDGGVLPSQIVCSLAQIGRYEAALLPEPKQVLSETIRHTWKMWDIFWVQRYFSFNLIENGWQDWINAYKTIEPLYVFSTWNGWINLYDDECRTKRIFFLPIQSSLSGFLSLSLCKSGGRLWRGVMLSSSNETWRSEKQILSISNELDTLCKMNQLFIGSRSPTSSSGTVSICPKLS